MGAFQLLKYDIKHGLLKRWYMYLIVVVFAIAECKECHNLICTLNSFELLHSNGTVMDYIVFSFKGMKVYNFAPRNQFTIPFYWFVFQIGVSYVVAYHTESDLCNNGRNILVACKSRLNWWISKVILCITSVLFYYAITVALIVVFACVNGATLSFAMTTDFSVNMYGHTMLYLSSNDVAFMIFVLPIITTVAICLFQVACSLIVSPVISFATVCVMYILSAYYTNPWFLGNYTMWQRCSYFAEDGISPFSGILLSSILLIVAIVFGSSLIKNKDIL